MTEATTELRFSRLVPSDGPIALPGAVRVLFVVSGSVSIESDDGGWPAQLGAEQAALREPPLRLQAEQSDTIALSWEVVVPGEGGTDAELAVPLELDPESEYLVRCDRVDFPPGGEALLHTHQGPGIRCLLIGQLDVTVEGQTKHLRPFDPWFESGPQPVYAAASEAEPTAFVRVMVLPRSLLGESSIRYVRDEDQSKPKSQRYTVYLDEPTRVPIRTTGR